MGGATPLEGELAGEDDGREKPEGFWAVAPALGWATLLVLFGVSILWPQPMHDTLKLYKGFVDVLKGVDLSEAHPGLRDYFGLLQHLILLPVIAMGWKFSTGFTILAACNAVALGLLVRQWLRWLGKGFSDAHAVALVVMLASPLVIYSRLTFQEGLMAGILGIWSLTSWAKNPWRWRVLLLLAAISKETAFAPLIFLHFFRRLSEIPQADFRLPRPKRVDVEAILLVLTGLGLSLLFNLWRFGTARNVFYQLPILRVDSISVWFEFLAAAFFSPNGGMVFHWPGLMLLLGVLVFAVKEKGQRRWFWPALFFLYTGFFAASFALWHSPFGWIAWGNRLLVPWLVPLAILASRQVPAGLLGRASWRLFAMAALLAGQVHWLIYVQYDVAQQTLFKAGKCVQEIDLFVHKQGYYDCMHTLLWPSPDFLHPMWKAMTRTNVGLIMVAVFGFGLLAIKRAGRTQLPTKKEVDPL